MTISQNKPYPLQGQGFRVARLLRQMLPEANAFALRAMLRRMLTMKSTAMLHGALHLKLKALLPLQSVTVR